MEKSRKKLWVCLFCVVMLAVAVGLIYYFTDLNNTGGMDDGVLITGMKVGWERLWR